MATITNGEERINIPEAPGYWLLQGETGHRLSLPVRRVVLHAPSRLREGTGNRLEMSVVGPREVPVARACIEQCPDKGTATFEIEMAAVAPAAAIVQLLRAVAAAAEAMGASRLFALVPLDLGFGIELLERAGFTLESVLTEGGVAEVALRVPSMGFESPAG